MLKNLYVLFIDYFELLYFSNMEFSISNFQQKQYQIPFPTSSKDWTLKKLESSRLQKKQKEFRNSSNLNLLKEDLVSHYSQLELATIILEESENIVEDWETTAQNCIKDYAQIIVSIFYKIQQRRSIQKQYKTHIYQAEVFKTVLAHTQRLQIAERYLLNKRVINWCKTAGKVLQYSDKHNMRKVVEETLIKCVQKKLSNKKFQHIINQLLNFILEYCSPLYKMFHELLNLFKQQLAAFPFNLQSFIESLREEKQNVLRSIHSHVLGDKLDSKIKCDQIKSEIMNLQIDLQIINTQIIEDIKILRRTEKQPIEKIQHEIQQFTSYSQKEQFSLFIQKVYKMGLQTLFNSNEKQETELLQQYLQEVDKSFSQDIIKSSFPQKQMIYTQERQDKSKLFIMRRVIDELFIYKEDLYSLYNQGNTSGQYNSNYEYSPKQCQVLKKNIFFRELDRQIISSIEEYLTNIARIGKAERRINYLQHQIIILKRNIFQLGGNQAKLISDNSRIARSKQSINMGLYEFQQSSRFSRNTSYYQIDSTQLQVLPKKSQQTTTNQVKKNNNFYFHISKQMHISQTLSQNKKKIINLNKLFKNQKQTSENKLNTNKQRLLYLGTKALIMKKNSDSTYQQIQIKRIQKIQVISSNRLYIHFSKGHMTIQFKTDENRRRNNMEEFILMFVQNYSDRYGQINFQYQKNRDMGFNEFKMHKFRQGI